MIGIINYFYCRLENEKSAIKSYRLQILAIAVISFIILLPNWVRAQSLSNDIVIFYVANNANIRPCTMESGGTIGPYTSAWQLEPYLTKDTSLDNIMIPALDWLKRNIYRVRIPIGAPEDVITSPVAGFYDPTIDQHTADDTTTPAPLYNNTRAAYLVSDSLYATEALQPYDPDLSLGLQITLQARGWYGNGLCDVIFRTAQLRQEEDTLPFVLAGSDPIHGDWVAECYNGSVRIEVHTFRMEAVDNYDYNEWAESAVYQGLYIWSPSIITNFINGTAKPGYGWDSDNGLLVDGSTDTDNVGNVGVATYKVALLIYALTYMDIPQGDPEWCDKTSNECQNIVLQMISRLHQAQIQGDQDCLYDGTGLDHCPDTGGFAHEVFYTKTTSGEATVAYKYMATSEATSLAMLAHEINPWNTPHQL
jgi:hypothetical protein